MESNSYLDQVVQQQAQVEGELRNRRGKMMTPGTPAPAFELREAMPGEGGFGAGGSSAAEYRVTGWWFKTVVVPPNAYVVHTRRGHAEPVTCGLGLSFRYDPYTDAFLVIPAAVQTLLINARCISAERQGVLVQAYVQWVIDDLRTAYRKLDFSDPADPMRLVNVQLREQAEAAIKDKVATVPIDEILSDRQPIIEELTLRLRAVAEGGRDAGSGLGLKIVTVQIKEAVVSSTRLWENLQKPFRADREKHARLAEIEARQQIAVREMETQRKLDELKATQEQDRHRLEQQAEQRRITERAETEKARRLADEALEVQLHELEAALAVRELEDVRRALELERAKAELEQLRARLTIDRENLEHQARSARDERDVEVLTKRRAVENQVSDGLVRARLIDKMPEIAAAMPAAAELRQITVSGDGSSALTGLVAQLLASVEGRAAGK
ncbi:MAG: SPFH domain-containing protein [Gemmataceae bacterium]